MQENQLYTSFGLSYFTDKATSKLASQHERILNLLSSFRCSDYSDNIVQIVVILVAFAPDTPQESDKLYYRKSKKMLEIRLNLDYGAVLAAENLQLAQLVAEGYLRAIERFLFARKDIDAQKLYSELMMVFQKEGLIAK